MGNIVEYSEVFHERCDQLDIITHMRTMVLEYAHQHLPLPKTTQLLVGFYIPAPWVAGHWVCLKICFFPTCQVRVVRFYVSCLLLSSSPLLLLLLNRDPRRTVFTVGPQPRPSTPSVPCRTSTTTIPAQCSLPDLNHDHPRPVFPAGPQPRVSTPSVPCRTSCRKIWDKECAEES